MTFSGNTNTTTLGELLLIIIGALALIAGLAIGIWTVAHQLAPWTFVLAYAGFTFTWAAAKIAWKAYSER